MSKNNVAKSLGLTKLEESGLTEKDAKDLGIEFLTDRQTAALHPSFNAFTSIKINYYDPYGETMPDWHACDPFYRIRYLEKPSGFDGMTDKKEVRYVQEPNTAPCAYFPRIEDWETICAEPDEPIIITEGEFKSAKACKEGFPTIGLGGVYNWKSNKLGIPWIQSLESIEWKRRCVYLCFDSDYKTNPMVCAALKQFAEELEKRGSYVFLVSLPQLPGLDKVGLDDFLVNAHEANDQFAALLTNATPLGMVRPLYEFNNLYCYVRNPGLVIDRKTFNKVSPSAFKEHFASTTGYQEAIIKGDGNVQYKQAPAAPAWLKWPLRSEVGRLTYVPGGEQVVDDNGAEAFNIWRGWGVSPEKGDVRLFKDLIDHLFTGAEPGAKQWFLQWLAYPIQNPGTKLFSTAVIHGLRQGTGKSLIGYTMGKIYGKNFTEINQMDLHNQYNEWAEAKQFVLGDDVTGSNKRQDADFLKKMITQREIRINAKYIPTYVVPDCINYIFTSQHADSFFLEDDDRRFFIHEVTVGPLSDDFYREYDEWLNRGPGASHLMHYLLNLKMGDFNPYGQAYRTDARDRMINNMRSDLAGFVRELRDQPDEILKVGKVAIDRDLFTSKELLAIYDPDGKTGTTAGGVARELAKGGFHQVYNGRPLVIPGEGQNRYYAVRNPEKWLKFMGPKHLVAHISDCFSKQNAKKRKKY